VSVRDQLKRLEPLLDEARRDPLLLRTHRGIAISDLLAEVSEQIQRLPQPSVIRPAVIAIQNLVVSLRRPEHSDGLNEELATVLEIVRELLSDRLFGHTLDSIRARVDDVLLAKGVHGCPACKRTNLRIELVYTVLRPLLSDPAMSPSQVPSALVVCEHCGFSSVHDLAILGVV
jgi:hypothetical protein